MMSIILKSVHFFNAFNVFKKAPIQKILKENLACDQTPKKTSSIHRKCSLQKKLLVHIILKLSSKEKINGNLYSELVYLHILRNVKEKRILSLSKLSVVTYFTRRDVHKGFSRINLPIVKSKRSAIFTLQFLD